MTGPTPAVYAWSLRLVAAIGLLSGAWACESPVAPAPGTTEWSALTLGDGHGCVIDRGARVACWGENGRGQLGLGRGGHTTEPAWMRTPVRFVMIDAGAFHTCGTAIDGTVWCWGANESGQLGTGDRTDRNVPARVALPGGDWVGVSAGFGHSCAVRVDGLGVCWGRNVSGELGIGSSSSEPLPPTAVAGEWREIDAARGHSCGVERSGRASCWGANPHGALGTGIASPSTSPGRVAGGRTWTSVVGGGGFSCGRADVGSVWCWGGDVAGFPVPGAGPGVGTPRVVDGVSATAGPAVGPSAWCASGGDGSIQCVTDSGGLRTFSPSGVVTTLAVSRRDICFLTDAGRLECRELAALRDS